jgi:hypothetical protein
VDLGVAAIDFEFLDAGGLLEFSDVEGFHFNDYRTNDKIAYWLGSAILKNITRNDPRRTGWAATSGTPARPTPSRSR